MIRHITHLPNGNIQVELSLPTPEETKHLNLDELTRPTLHDLDQDACIAVLLYLTKEEKIQQLRRELERQEGYRK
jgi:hypothetical protein